MRLGELLVQFGAISREQLSTALRRQEALGGGGNITAQLVDLGYITEDAVSAVLVKRLQLPMAMPAALESIPATVTSLINATVARNYCVCPVRVDGKRLYVAMVDPTDKEVIAELVRLTSHDVRPLVASESSISYALDKYYPRARAGHSVQLAQGAHLDELAIEPLSDGLHKIGGVPPPLPQARQPLPTPAVAGLPPRPRHSTEPPMAPPAGTAQPEAPVVARPVIAGRATLADFGAWLLSSSSQPELFAATLGFLGRDFGRIVMLAFRDGYLCGWRSRGPVNEQAVREFVVPPAAIPVVARMVEDQTPRLGRAALATLGPLTDVIGPPGERAMLLLPALYAGNVIGAFIALDGRDGIESWYDEYVTAVEKLDFALRMLELRDRILS
jgi:type II secretion system (T2SS) protein E